MTFFYNLPKIIPYRPIPSIICQVSQNLVIPMYLTPAERKKLRRRKRAEKEQQKQDRIKLGLQAPPPPKVKLSNMMRILGDE
jgi:U4/U6 small nuclear ribonucleoprotein PRP3